MSQSAARTIAVGVALAVVAAPSTAGRSARPLLGGVQQLARDGRFSGAVVIRGPEGVRLAKGFGMADPFSGRRFEPNTPVDSASLAKPVTAAAVLLLAQDGRLDLDSSVRRYIPVYPHEQVTVRQLLAHSAGLPVEAMLEPISGKSNEMLLLEMSQRKLAPLFPPGSAFLYCNFCYTTLALLIERVSSKPYLQVLRESVGLPAAVTLRPAKLSEWRHRAIGYRRDASGQITRADSYENELFYGSANLSISALQLADWGAKWWGPKLSPIRKIATTPASINGKVSGLTWGNWYCAPGGRRCHYLGHHEGFHHMVYWDSEHKISVAMTSNNTLSPTLQQRLQRAIVATATGQDAIAARELSQTLPDNDVVPGEYRFPTGERVSVIAKGSRVAVVRGGLTYLAFKIGFGIRYVPGLDVYVAGADAGGLHWLSLYEDMVATPAKERKQG